MDKQQLLKKEAFEFNVQFFAGHGAFGEMCFVEGAISNAAKQYHSRTVKDINLGWVEQNEIFGLDYSTKKGVFHDYSFDIRYDYCGERFTKPDCGLTLTVSKNNVIIHYTFGNSIDYLTKYAEDYIKKEADKFKEFFI